MVSWDLFADTFFLVNGPFPESIQIHPDPELSGADLRKGKGLIRTFASYFGVKSYLAFCTNHL